MSSHVRLAAVLSRVSTATNVLRSQVADAEREILHGSTDEREKNREKMISRWEGIAAKMESLF